MISKSWSRKSIATVVAVAVLSVYSMLVLAAPSAKASGALAVSGQVKVNGQKMPDSPRTDPGVRFSRTGLFVNTRFRNKIRVNF